MPIRFGREIAEDLSVLESREWLVTNGIGGYGSGSAAGSLTRGYHGLLVAALSPPVDRRVMLVKVDEQVSYRGIVYDLGTNRWVGGSISPEGYKNIQSFELEGSVPLWTFACGDALIEKRIWMQQGKNTTFVSYKLFSATEPVTLSISAIVDNRIFHNTGQVAWPANIVSQGDQIRVISGPADARPLILQASSGSIVTGPDLYTNFYLPAETVRGLRDSDDHVHAATFTAMLAPGATLNFLASAEDAPSFADLSLDQRKAQDKSLLDNWQKNRIAGAAPAPDWIEQLILAADQFVVNRPSANQPNGKSVIAGYHWFDDWGRDTMVSLPGLALVPGRASDAAPILRTFARFVSQGMLPNRFPDGPDQPLYNTIDATLWYFQAIRSYHNATGDDSILNDLYPVLAGIIDWHMQGTRFQIKVDPADGLLRGGQQGVQLTWMDAIVNNVVITPRIGKPVEVNALWYNALTAMVAFSKKLAKPAGKYQSLASAALTGFDRFWNPAKGYCFDVLDGPNGNEDLLRPNQLFAVSLPDSPLSADRQRAVVESCSHALLTSYGLRSLAPTEAAYQGFYGGDQAHRDGAYHQGTVWAWLLGAFIDAHLRVFQDKDAAMQILTPIGDHLSGVGLKTVSEIFDGDAPFAPKGCIAQAWSVAEAIRSFDQIERFQPKA
ncbi:MAG: amylo-alpha-1,6-glucosidase [Terracidiphilus sp.]|jgi:predicted glycogen debranching enzyme